MQLNIENNNLLEVYMKSNLKILNGLMIIILAVSLSACGPSAPAEPTIDPNMIKTEAVQTAFAQMTLEAIMNPSVTPTATATALPTSTTAPTFTATAATQVALPGVATKAVALPGVAPQPASGLAPVSTGDKAEWVSQSPVDGYKIYLKTDESAVRNFDLIWTVKNIGTTTWNTTYKARYFSGAKFFNEVTEVKFRDASVPPGGTTNIIIDVTCPSAAGTYLTTWVLSNPDGANFYVVTFEFTVVDGVRPASES
jgi:hypothetical protein